MDPNSDLQVSINPNPENNFMVVFVDFWLFLFTTKPLTGHSNVPMYLLMNSWKVLCNL
jgi:hypothetical protein